MYPRRLIVLELIVTLVALAGAIFALISRAAPGTEAVRLRNSLIATTGTIADFDWNPTDVPPEYQQERTTIIPSALRTFVLAATADPKAPVTDAVGESSAAIRLAAALARQGRRGQALQGDTVTVFSTIVTEGGGYCADYTQVFNALAYVADIPVREWGMSFDGFGGDGHAFNEIYDRRLQKWVLLDVFNGFYPVDRTSGLPLSALEFRGRLTQSDVLETTAIIPVGPRPRFRELEDAVAYYRRGQFGFSFGGAMTL